MFGLSPVELMVVGIVAILLFGSKLPEVARSVGGSYREFRKGLSEFQDHVRIADFTSPPPPKTKQVERDEEDDQYVETSAPKFVPPVSRTASSPTASSPTAPSAEANGDSSSQPA